MNKFAVLVETEKVRRRDLLVDRVLQDRVGLAEQQVRIEVNADCVSLELGERQRNKCLV